MPSNKYARQTAYRQRVLAAGAVRFDTVISAECAAALDALAAKYGESRTAVIERLLRQAAARV